MLESVAVGRATSVAVALAGVLSLATADLAAELLDLELVERLEEVADETALGARLIAGGDRVVDVDARLRELALERERVEQITSEPRGRVDDDRVEATVVSVARLADQLAPVRAVVAPARLLVGEVDDDPASQLLDLALA